ncbi:hypothetical protein T484DRAFT_1882155 [Baffinella frigidus]|nr:hypothetical protein T484DRAFT_1882155 [Cryptophyta sp. CCMP2293]
MTNITKPMIQIASLEGDMPPIFGGAGHHNHVGFCQPAHLYDEDFDDIGSDRDELEDLREMDEEDSVAGGGRSSTRSRLNFGAKTLPPALQRVTSGASVGGASVVSHRSASHVSVSVVSRTSRRSGATNISTDPFWKSFSHAKAHNNRMHSSHTSRAGATRASNGGTMTISRATCPSHSHMENLGISSLTSTLLLAGPDHSPLSNGKEAAAANAITRNFMSGESINYASVSCMGNAAHSHDDAAHKIFAIEDDDGEMDDIPVRRSGIDAVRRPTSTFITFPDPQLDIS